MPAFAQDVDTVSNNTELQKAKNATYTISVTDFISLGNGTKAILINEEFFLIAWVPTIAATVSTGILALITFFYFRETRKIRRLGHQPSFSLEPHTWTLGGTAHVLNLVNSGEAASNIDIDCFWEQTVEVKPDTEPTKPDTEPTKPVPIKIETKRESRTKKFFVMSLGTNGRARLDGIPIGHFMNNGGELTIKIQCNDSIQEPFEIELTFDFDSVKKNDRTLAFQYDPADKKKLP